MEKSCMFGMNFISITEFDWLPGQNKGTISE